MVAHASGVRSPCGCAALDFDFGIRVESISRLVRERPAASVVRAFHVHDMELFYEQFAAGFVRTAQPVTLGASSLASIR